MKIWMVVILAVAVLPHDLAARSRPWRGPVFVWLQEDFWRTDTSWFLVSSWSDKDIDYQCLSEKGRAAAARERPRHQLTLNPS